MADQLVRGSSFTLRSSSLPRGPRANLSSLAFYRMKVSYHTLQLYKYSVETALSFTEQIAGE